MAKKVIVGVLVALSLAVAAVAQDAPKASPLKIGYAFTQMLGAENNNGTLAKAGIYSWAGNAEYSRTNFKVTADFDLGGGVKLSPWIQERLEIKNDPAAAAAADNFRNRFYAGLKSSFAIDKAFNVYLDLEYRNATYIKSSTVTGALPESRFTPYLGFTGQIEGLYYSLVTDLPIFFDVNGSNTNDESAYELEGTYNLGYAFDLGEKTYLKLDLNYYFDIVNFTLSTTTGVKYAVGQELRPKLILSSGDVAPFVGFLQSATQNNFGAFTNTVTGVTFGADLKIGSGATFNVTGDVGVDSVPASQPLVTAVYASLVIKG